MNESYLICMREETTIRNLKGLPMLQKLFDKFGIQPTYLLNYPFATDNKAVTLFKEKTESGCHIHKWNIPLLWPEKITSIFQTL